MTTLTARAADHAELSRSHLRVCDQAFSLLTCSPDPWTLDCTTVGGVPGAGLGLPEGPVPLPKLRDWMLAHRDNHEARDAIWRELITRARTIGRDWRIAAVGMAMPALVRFAGNLARDYPGDPADVDNEILTAFLEALQRRVDLGGERLYSKLCWAGFRAGYAARYADVGVVFVDDLDGEPGNAPYLPYSHVDLLLARAVGIQVIDADEANLILATRLEYRTIEQVAAATGIDPAVLRMRRKRAEARVVDAVTDGLLSGGLVSPAARQRLANDAAVRAQARARFSQQLVAAKAMAA
jgi:hypothetical protein